MEKIQKQSRYEIRFMTEKGNVIVGRYFDSRDGIKKDLDEVKTLISTNLKEHENELIKQRKLQKKNIDKLILDVVITDNTIILDEFKNNQIILNTRLDIGDFTPKIRYKVNIKPIIKDIIKLIRK